MSVPAALTAILTLGPAYGFQLHTELGARLPHRAHTNVGQIYSTLDRLVRDGYVSRVDETADGLPLYSLTNSGRHEAQSWLAGREISESSSWVDIMDVVCAGASIADAPLSQACATLERYFRAVDHTDTSLANRARHHFAQAVVAVVADTRDALAAGTLPLRELSEERPVRGRRPNIVTQ